MNLSRNLQIANRYQSDSFGKAGGMNMRAAQSGWGYLFASDPIREGDDYRKRQTFGVPGRAGG